MTTEAIDPKEWEGAMITLLLMAALANLPGGFSYFGLSTTVGTVPPE